MSSKCIKISASSGSGTCIKISVFRGEGCITVTPDKPDEEEIPPLPIPVIEWSFECFDIIAHGLFEFIVIGKNTKTLDGTPVLEEMVLATVIALTGGETEPIPIYEFEQYQIVSDITPECYLNAFDPTSGLNNFAIVYPGGTKVRYFDWGLDEISLIEDRHGYIYDAFHKTDETMASSEYVSETKTYYYDKIVEKGGYQKGYTASWYGGCTSPDASFEALLSTVPQQSASCFGVVKDNAYGEGDILCYNNGKPVKATVTWSKTVYIDTYSLSGANSKINLYSIDTSTITDYQDIGNSTTDHYTATLNCADFLPETSPDNGTKHWVIDTGITKPDYSKYGARELFSYYGGIFTSTEDEIKNTALVNSTCKMDSGYDYGGYRIQYIEMGDNNSTVVGAGVKYEPSKYIQLNGGDPHKIQTGQDWTAIGSACISTDRAFVCENLPTTGSGKTGAIVGDRCVVPIDNAEGIKALFSLDPSFIIDEHKIPAEFVI